MPRFHIPLIKPDVRLSRIRLSPDPSGLRPRQVGTSQRDSKEAKRLVEILVRDLGEPGASTSRSAHQPAAHPTLRVSSNQMIDSNDGPLIEVATPAAQEAADAIYRGRGCVGIPLRGCPFVDSLEQSAYSFP